MSSEPTRWLESTEQPELLSLMRVGADELAPADVLARVGERLLRSTSAADVSVSSGLSHDKSHPPPAVATGFGLKMVGVAMLLFALSLSLYLALLSRPEAHRSPQNSALQRPLPAAPSVLAPEPLAPSPAKTDTGPEISPAVARRPADAQSTRRPRKARELPTARLVEPADTRLIEAKLLEQARKELAARPDHALVLLHDHATQFPASWLEEERAALSIRALVATGQHPEARTLLRSFEARFPGSLHTPRLRRVLAEP